MDQPGKIANPARGQLNRENNIPLSPCVPENLVSRDGFSRPVPRQPSHLHTQAESGAYLRDSSRVPRRRPFMLCTQSVHSFAFPPRPLRTAPSRFPNMICFGNRPPLIWRSVPAHKSLLARNVVSMLSHRVISRARLYEVIRWSGLLRCAPMMRSKTRWCTVRSLA